MMRPWLIAGPGPINTRSSSVANYIVTVGSASYPRRRSTNAIPSYHGRELSPIQHPGIFAYYISITCYRPHAARQHRQSHSHLHSQSQSQSQPRQLHCHCHADPTPDSHLHRHAHPPTRNSHHLKPPIRLLIQPNPRSRTPAITPNSPTLH